MKDGTKLIRSGRVIRLISELEKEVERYRETARDMEERGYKEVPSGFIMKAEGIQYAVDCLKGVIE